MYNFDKSQKEDLNMEEITNKIHSLRLLESEILSKIRLLPSNNQLRKISRCKFEALKFERDQQLKPLKDELLTIESQIEALKAQILTIQDQQVQQIEFNPNHVDTDFVEILNLTGFNTDFLIEKAQQGNPLARDLLYCWECIPEGRGYDGYSMSKNALASYSNNQKPLSKFNKSDAVAFTELFEVKTTLKNLKEFLKLYGNAGSHHTSKYYNATAFYSLAIALKNCKKESFEKFFTNNSNFCKSKQDL